MKARSAEAASSERVVDAGGVRVDVREGRVERSGRVRHVAELSVEGDWDEHALVEADSREELTRLVAVAALAFGASVRLRRPPK